MKKIRPLFWVRVLGGPPEDPGHSERAVGKEQFQIDRLKANKPLAQFEKHKEYPVLGVVWSEGCVYVVNDNGGIHQVDHNRCVVSRQQFSSAGSPFEWLDRWVVHYEKRVDDGKALAFRNWLYDQPMDSE